MKKVVPKLAPESIPALLKTIKRSQSPDPTKFYDANFCEMKTRKFSVKDSTPLFPPIELKRKRSLNCKINTLESLSEDHHIDLL